MIPRKTAGLVGAGGVSQSFLARMPALLALLGPVKGDSFHVSRRIANALRAGKAARDFVEFAACELIWIAVPERQIDAHSAELAAAVALESKMVVVCDALRDSFWPSPIRTAGARVATLNCLPGSDEKIFVAEGDPAVLAELRRIVALDRRKLLALDPATKPLYLSGVHLLDHMLLPWIAGAMESFRAAGFSRAEAAEAMQTLGIQAIRAYSKAGSKAWNHEEAEQLRSALAPDLPAIRRTDPRLAILFGEGYDRLFRFFETQVQDLPVNDGSEIEILRAVKLGRAKAGSG